MKNALGSDFKVSFDSPSSRSTRCHQLAMYVVYESPLQMLADSPSNYRKELACLEFIKATPTIWDETQVLFGEVGDHVVIARRSGQRWFLGGMAGENATHIDLKLDFLPEGTFKLKAWQDGGNAHRNAEDYRILESQVSRLSTVPVRMAPGGGWAAIIEQVANKSPRIAKDQ